MYSEARKKLDKLQENVVEQEAELFYELKIDLLKIIQKIDHYEKIESRFNFRELLLELLDKGW